MRYQDQDFFPSLALQSVREYEKIPDQEIAAYIAETGLERIQFGKHLLLPSRDGTALINYTGPYRTYPQYSMADVIDGTVPPAALKDKIVLVGATAMAIGDLRNTPFQSGTASYMGVEVHANIIDNLLHSGEPGRTFLTRGIREELIDVAFHRAVWPWHSEPGSRASSRSIPLSPWCAPWRCSDGSSISALPPWEGGSALSFPPARWWRTTP